MIKDNKQQELSDTRTPLLIIACYAHLYSLEFGQCRTKHLQLSQ